MATAQALSKEEKIQLILAHKAQEKRRQHAGYKRYFPDEGPLSYHQYRRILRFFSAGKEYRERMLIAGNRVGKTIAGAFEVSCHATGEYPHWWTGRRFDHPVQIWVIGKTAQTTRDVIQRELLGEPNKLGTGMIPAEKFEGQPKAKPGVPNGVEVCSVKHSSGGTSVIGFKSHEQGIKSFYGTAKHVIWCDEEPPNDIYGECLMRTMVSEHSPKGGMIFTTFTPLEGWTQYIEGFKKSADEPPYGPETPLIVRRGESPNSRLVVTAGMDHAPHLDPETIEEILAQYEPMEQEARRNGVPSMHGGRIYPVHAIDYVIEPIQIYPHYRKAYAMDVGWNHTAALFGAYDADRDVLYIYDEYLRSKAEPEIHAQSIKYKYPRNTVLTGVIDPHSGDSNPVDGKKLLDIYRRLGLRLIPAENPVNAGIYDVWSRLSTGRIKVFSHCVNFLREIKMYRRNVKGKVVKEDDHIMDCLRYLVVSGLKVARADQVPDTETVRGSRTYI